MSTHDFRIVAGTASTKLAGEVAALLENHLSHCVMERFPDGELSVRLESSVRGHPVLLIHTVSPPVTERLFQLLLMVDACRRAAAGRIIAVVPYLGYSRSDKRHERREAIAASLVAQLLETTGLDHLITLDLHARQIEGFYRIPVDNLSAVPVLCDALESRLSENTVVVSPDEGRVHMAGLVARRFASDVALIQKKRLSGSETRSLRVIGWVKDRPCLIVDDMITTGATLARAVDALLEAGALPDIQVAATHGVFTEEARQRLDHRAIRRMLVTDSIPRDTAGWPELGVASVAPLLAAAIKHVASRESIGDLFPIAASD